LHRLLADPRPRVRDELTLALGQSGDPAAARLVEPLLAAADPDARRVAILALVRLGAGPDLAARVPPQERAFARAALQARPPGQLLGSTSFIAPRR
jgi:HEAT repeat protein